MARDLVPTSKPRDVIVFDNLRNRKNRRAGQPSGGRMAPFLRLPSGKDPSPIELRFTKRKRLFRKANR